MEVVVVSTMVDTDIDPMAIVNERMLSSELLVAQFEAANPSPHRSAAEERPCWGTGR